MRRLVLVGAVAGLAWAAGLRGWMIQMAATEGSTFRWYGTFLLILLPAPSSAPGSGWPSTDGGWA